MNKIRMLFAKISCWLLLVALLNNITDTVITNPVTSNEIESVAEWVVEEWMDMEIPIPDTDGEQDDKQQVQKKASDWFSPQISFLITLPKNRDSSYPCINEPFYFNPVFDILTPPPDKIS